MDITRKEAIQKKLAKRSAKKEESRVNKPNAIAFAKKFKEALDIQTDEIKLLMLDKMDEMYVCFRHTDHLKHPEILDPLDSCDIIVCFRASSNYPFDPPTFIFITPTGTFSTKEQPCVEIGMYHRTAYSPSMGLGVFIMNIIGALIDPKTLEHGIGITMCDEKTRTKYSKASRKYNKNHRPDLVDAFDALFGTTSDMCL